MKNNNPKMPIKGGSSRLRDLYIAKKKSSKPNPELIEILEQQRIQEQKDRSKKSASGVRSDSSQGNVEV